MRIRRLAALLAILVAALVVAACGGDDGGGGGGASTATTQQTQTQTGSGGTQAAAAGKTVFTENCGGCHTLQAAGTNGTTGPNLDELQPDQQTVEQQVRNGGGGMPSFEGRLSDAQIKAVARYVSSNAGG